MPKITPDFSEVLESSPVPAGTYSVRIEKAELKDSKAGNSYINWQLRIFGASGELQKQNNRVVSLMTMLKGPAADRLQRLYKVTTGTTPPKDGFDTDELIGKEFEAQLTDNFRPDGTQGWPNVKPLRALQG